MTQSIRIDGQTLPAVTHYVEDEMFLDIYVTSMGGTRRRSYAGKAARSFILEWVGLTPVEVSTLRVLALKLACYVLVLEHPTEGYTGSELPAQFSVVLNPRSPGLEVNAMQAWDSQGNGPVLYEAKLELVTQRPENDVVFSALRYPVY